MYVIQNPQDITVSRISDHISIVPHKSKGNFEYPERSDLDNGCFTLADFKIQLDIAYESCVAYVDAVRDGKLLTYMYRTKLNEWWFLGSMPE